MGVYTTPQTKYGYAPGYYNPDNPNDRGYVGQRNYSGGRINYSNWDYEAGKPKGNAKIDPNTGYYILTPTARYDEHAGGGGGSIPGAGTYLDAQALAQLSYDQALAALKAQRAAQQHAAGLNDKWQVDPLAIYGTYQGMLHDQGQALDLADESSQQRGLFGKGLGMQAEAPVRYAAGVQNLGFQNTIGGYEAAYQQQVQQIEMARQMAMLAALQNAQSGADYPTGDPWGGDAPPDAPATTAAKRPSGKTVVIAPQNRGLPSGTGTYTPTRTVKRPAQQPRLSGTQVRHK